MSKLSPTHRFAPSSLSLFLVDAETVLGENRHSSARKALQHPALHIANWVLISNVTILFNKWILDTAGFRYPILLTCWHLTFATVATQILARTTTLLDSRHKLSITPRLYLRIICPIGFLYSGSLVCSNVVYLYLSVSFIQMLKSAAPVIVLFASWAWRVSSPCVADFVNVLVIVAGVALTSVGEIRFSVIGFAVQLTGVVFEAIRVVMIQVLLSADGLKMDALVGLYYYAPICAVMNFLVAAPGELQRFSWTDVDRVGFSLLFLNAFIAFFLNIISVFLIGKTSGLAMTLTGIFKNILLIFGSILIWRTETTFVQGFGYTVTLAGLIYYSIGYERLAIAAAQAGSFLPLPSTATANLGDERYLGNFTHRRSAFVVVVALSSLIVASAVLRHYDLRVADVFTLPSFFGTE